MEYRHKSDFSASIVSYTPAGGYRLESALSFPKQDTLVTVPGLQEDTLVSQESLASQRTLSGAKTCHGAHVNLSTRLSVDFVVSNGIHPFPSHLKQWWCITNDDPIVMCP